MKIRNATSKDIPRILEIQEKLLLKNITTYDRGFLAYPLSSNELQQRLEIKENIILIVENDTEVIGYLIGFPLKEFKSIFEDWYSLLLISLKEEGTDENNVFYHEYIAIKPGNKGAGSMLMYKLLEKLQSTTFKHIVCEILHEPALNTTSIGFHTHFGFNLIKIIPFKVTVQRTWGIYLKNL